MASPHFDRELAVRILTAAATIGDDEAAKRFRVSTRTVQRYRQKLADDEQLAKVVEAEKEALRPVLRELLTNALHEVVGVGVNLAKSSDNLYHVAGFAKILSDALNADTVIEKGIGDGGLGQPGAIPPRAGPTLTEAPRRALAILGGGKPH